MFWYQRFRRRMVDDPRFSRVMKGSFSALMARVLTILVAVVTLPLTLHYLGQLEYGIWVTISTSVVMLSVLDLGIANTLTNFIAEAYAEDDRLKAQQYFATAFWVVIGIVLLLIPLAFAVWHVVDWGTLFHLTDPALVKQISRCVAIAGVFFLISLPLGLAYRVVIGYQETHFANYFAIYDGNVTTDGKGEAVVTMPRYFESLNRDLRYQLTVIGQPAQAYVASEMSGDVFVIKTDKPGVKVSWQVTGIRQDAWANANRVTNEEDKPAAERGRYLHPELFGHKGELGIHERHRTKLGIGAPSLASNAR